MGNGSRAGSVHKRSKVRDVGKKKEDGTGQTRNSAKFPREKTLRRKRFTGKEGGSVDNRQRG